MFWAEKILKNRVENKNMKPDIIDTIYKKIYDIYHYELDAHDGYESETSALLRSLLMFIVENNVEPHTLELSVEELFSTDRKNKKRFLNISCKD